MGAFVDEGSMVAVAWGHLPPSREDARRTTVKLVTVVNRMRRIVRCLIQVRRGLLGGDGDEPVPLFRGVLAWSARERDPPSLAAPKGIRGRRYRALRRAHPRPAAPRLAPFVVELARSWYVFSGARHWRPSCTEECFRSLCVAFRLWVFCSVRHVSTEIAVVLAKLLRQNALARKPHGSHQPRWD